MAYTIDFSLACGEAFYHEIVLRDAMTGGPLAPYGGGTIDHQFAVWAEGCDYGEPGPYSQIVASNSNGLIHTPLPSVFAILLPPTAFDVLGPWQTRQRTLRHSFRAVPSNTSIIPALLFDGAITFGGRR